MATEWKDGGWLKSEEAAPEKPKTTRKKTAAAKEKTEEKPKRTRKKAAEKIEE